MCCSLAGNLRGVKQWTRNMKTTLGLHSSIQYREPVSSGFALWGVIRVFDVFRRRVVVNGCLAVTLICTNLIGSDRELEVLIVRDVRPPDGKSLLPVELEDVDDLSM